MGVGVKLDGIFERLHFFKEVTAQVAPATYARFIRFLQEELAISTASIALIQRHREQDPFGSPPMVLWQYGLITLEQLDRIFDWMETA